jgi:hypothetical protein
VVLALPLLGKHSITRFMVVVLRKMPIVTRWVFEAMTWFVRFNLFEIKIGRLKLGGWRHG